MICILSGTNRVRSKTRQVAGLVQKLYEDFNEKTHLVDLKKLPLESLFSKPYGKNIPQPIRSEVLRLNRSSGLVIVCPEYNGSFPGILKFFMDHWDWPVSFRNRKCALVGLGASSGGRQALRHLQDILHRGQALIYHQKVFLPQVQELVKGGRIQSPSAVRLLKKQTRGFLEFIQKGK